MTESNYPEHWDIRTLGAVTEIVKGGTPSRSVDEYFQGNVAWAIPSDITALDSALYIHDTASHISEEGLSKSAAKLLPSGTVLLTSRATIGETAIPTIPMATNQGFANFICNDEILNVYLAYYLRHIKKKLNVLASGSTFKEVTKGTLVNVEIPLPPLPEQRAIANILQTIQEAKLTRKREIELERERKAALMDFLFTHGTKGEPRIQTEIGEVPESWGVVRLEEVATFTKKPRDLRYSEYNEIPFVPMELIPIAKLFSKEFLLKTNDELSSGTYFEPGNILIPKITPSFENGKQCIIQELPTPFGIATTEVIPIREVAGISDKFFLFYYLLLPNVRISLAGKMQGTTGRQRLNKDSLVNLEIPLPSLPEQRAIANIFRAIDEKTAALEREVELIDELFHAMLEELMTGKRSAVPLIDAEMDG